MIRRIDPDTTMSRATVHNGVIYFCGHVAPGAYDRAGDKVADPL